MYYIIEMALFELVKTVTSRECKSFVYVPDSTIYQVAHQIRTDLQIIQRKSINVQINVKLFSEFLIAIYRGLLNVHNNFIYVHVKLEYTRICPQFLHSGPIYIHGSEWICIGGHTLQLMDIHRIFPVQKGICNGFPLDILVFTWNLSSSFGPSPSLLRVKISRFLVTNSNSKVKLMLIQLARYLVSQRSFGSFVITMMASNSAYRMWRMGNGGQQSEKHTQESWTTQMIS